MTPPKKTLGIFALLNGLFLNWNVWNVLTFNQLYITNSKCLERTANTIPYPKEPSLTIKSSDAQACTHTRTLQRMVLLKGKLRHIEIFMNLFKQELIRMGQHQTRSVWAPWLTGARG